MTFADRRFTLDTLTTGPVVRASKYRHVLVKKWEALEAIKEELCVHASLYSTLCGTDRAIYPSSETCLPQLLRSREYQELLGGRGRWMGVASGGRCVDATEQARVRWLRAQYKLRGLNAKFRRMLKESDPELYKSSHWEAFLPHWTLEEMREEIQARIDYRVYVPAPSNNPPSPCDDDDQWG